MKRLNVLLLLILLSVLFISGGRTPSITDSSIVHAIGVDRSDEGYLVTLQIFKPEAAGADTPIDISKANFKNISTAGKDMQECLYKLSGRAGSELFLGHMQLLVLGKDIEIGDISELVSPLRDDKSIYSGLYLACAENAGETVSFPIKENAVTAENYRLIIENAAARGSAFSARLIDIDNVLGECGALAMPYLEIEGEKGKQSLDVTGSLILSSHGFEGDIITPDECSCLSLMCKTYTGLTLPHELHLSSGLVPLSDISRDICFSKQSGRLCCDITLTATAGERLTDPEGVSAGLSEKLSRLLDKYLKERDADAVRLFEQLRLREPTLFARNKSRLYQLYDDTRFSVQCDILKS